LRTLFQAFILLLIFGALDKIAKEAWYSSSGDNQIRWSLWSTSSRDDHAAIYDSPMTVLSYKINVISKKPEAANLARQNLLSELVPGDLSYMYWGKTPVFNFL
jgi:accessory colonization factor AcfC